MDAFKFDTILSSLHDLQQGKVVNIIKNRHCFYLIFFYTVKSTNEMNLEEERSKRRQLESNIVKGFPSKLL